MPLSLNSQSLFQYSHDLYYECYDLYRILRKNHNHDQEVNINNLFFFFFFPLFIFQHFYFMRQFSGQQNLLRVFVILEWF